MTFTEKNPLVIREAKDINSLVFPYIPIFYVGRFERPKTLFFKSYTSFSFYKIVISVILAHNGYDLRHITTIYNV